MIYPFWDVPFGYGILMAVIAVLHYKHKGQLSAGKSSAMIRDRRRFLETVGEAVMLVVGYMLRLVTRARPVTQPLG